jgi:hypothetical protein
VREHSASSAASTRLAPFKHAVDLPRVRFHRRPLRSV